MADVASRPHLPPPGPRAAEPAVNAAPPPPSTNPTSTKKDKGKKAPPDPLAKQKALQDKIAQLEQDRAGRNEEDAEIEREVRKSNRELQNMLSTMDSANAKAEHLQRKYTELLGDLKRTEREHARAKKRADLLQKEKDTQRSELTKTTSMKDKLEKLSRDLNKENKHLKEDLRETKEAAQDKNNELHQRLEQMMDDVEYAIQSREAPDRFDELDEEQVFKEKFKSMVEQYEMREIHMASVLRTRELEIRWHEAQHERLKKSQDAELNKSHQLTRQVSTFSQTENELRSQLEIYVSKFKQVEDTLNNSNDLFLTFRREMTDMAAKTKRLEKENMQLTRKQETTNKNIFQMAEERSQSQDDIKRLTLENEKLKKLCRAMQTNGYSRVAGTPGDAAAVVNNTGEAIAAAGPELLEDEEDLDETDSEYDEYDEDEDGEEYDDETDEGEDQEPQPKVFGPPLPPNLADSGAGGPQQHDNRRRQVNGVNGVRH